MPRVEITSYKPTSRYLSHVPIWITSDLPTTQCSLLALLQPFTPGRKRQSAKCRQSLAEFSLTVSSNEAQHILI